uniref:Phosphoribosylaminoimidazole-succinocarboxamide synthase n=1 Tax=Anthurium amnicola TaxID=1678845 RepID=A0A1D1XKZ0_9ARAE
MSQDETYAYMVEETERGFFLVFLFSSLQRGNISVLLWGVEKTRIGLQGNGIISLNSFLQFSPFNKTVCIHPPYGQCHISDEPLVEFLFLGDVLHDNWICYQPLVGGPVAYPVLLHNIKEVPNVIGVGFCICFSQICGSLMSY